MISIAHITHALFVGDRMSLIVQECGTDDSSQRVQVELLSIDIVLVSNGTLCQFVTIVGVISYSGDITLLITSIMESFDFRIRLAVVCG